MDIFVVFIIIFISLVLSIYKGITIVYPLLFGLLLFVVICMRRGFRFKALLSMILAGGKKSLTMVRIFVLIGAIIPVWMAAGTVEYIVYYGIKLMNPQYFIISAFVISAFVSFILGTAIGTAGTIGMALMVLAKSGQVDVNVAAGAIIAGAYFGDRCSPMSSSANLVAVLTDTDLYKNIRNMFLTTIIPLIFAMVIYTFVSINHPLYFGGNGIEDEISRLFNLHPVVIIPAVIILMFALFKINVRTSMLVSIVAGTVVAILFQNQSLDKMLFYAIAGYKMNGDSILNNILSGGGILSMVKIAMIVFVSSTYSGIFEGTGLLTSLEIVIKRFSNRYGVFPATFVTSIITSCFGCTQALAILLTHQLMKKEYKSKGQDQYKLAIDIENTAVVISPLIPWNIAGAVPAAMLGAGPGFILYAVYLFLVPLFNFPLNQIIKKASEPQTEGSNNQ
ncbi:MAG: Na+/H+ antiporter NhaC family protein [Clostridia bacterium]